MPVFMQYVALQTQFQTDEVEILMAKELDSNLSSSTSMVVPISNSTIVDMCKDEMQTLEAHETLGGLQIICNSSKARLVRSLLQNIIHMNLCTDIFMYIDCLLTTVTYTHTSFSAINLPFFLFPRSFWHIDQRPQLRNPKWKHCWSLHEDQLTIVDTDILEKGNLK